MKFHVVILRPDGASGDPETLDSVRAQQGVEIVGIDSVRACGGATTPDAPGMAAVLAGTDADYVALVRDGERWTSRDKLRFQLDWLTEHEYAAGCFHAAEVHGASRRAEPPGCADFYAADDVWSEARFVPLSALVFRRKVLASWPGWCERPLAHPDFVIPALLTEDGPLGYIDEGWCEIAETPDDAASDLETEILERRFAGSKLLFRHEARLERFVARHSVDLARACLAERRYDAARRHLWRAFAELPFATVLRAGTLPLRLLFPTRRRVS